MHIARRLGVGNVPWRARMGIAVPCVPRCGSWRPAVSHWSCRAVTCRHAAPRAGNFTLYGYKNGMQGPMLYTVPDTNTPSLTPYEGSIAIPADAPPGDYVLQLICESCRVSLNG